MYEKTYEVGKNVKFLDGSVYVVESLYTLSPEEMQKYELYQAHRVRMRKISGHGPEKIDFAVNRGE
jgi:hypothetical protein